MGKTYREDELTSLINEADQELHRKRPKAKPPLQVPYLSWLIRVGLLVLLLVLWIPLLHSPPQQQIVDDLQAVLQLARTSVDSWQEKMGELPVTLPDPELARLVAYSPEGATYTLRIRNGKTALLWHSADPETYTEVEANEDNSTQ